MVVYHTKKVVIIITRKEMWGFQMVLKTFSWYLTAKKILRFFTEFS